MSDLSEIIDGAEPEVTPEPTVEVTPEVTPEADLAPEVTPEPEAKPEPTVPLAALLEVRQELQGLKSQMQTAAPQQPPAPAPDVLENQAGFEAHMGRQISQQVNNVKLDISEEMTRAAHGDEKVDAAFSAIQASNNPALQQSILQARNPWGELVKWHDQQQIAAEIGNDPAAYRAKVEGEVRAKIEAEMVAKQAKEVTAKAAPSMADLTGTGGGPRTTWNGPASLSSVLPE